MYIAIELVTRATCNSTDGDWYGGKRAAVLTQINSFTARPPWYHTQKLTDSCWNLTMSENLQFIYLQYEPHTHRNLYIKYQLYVTYLNGVGSLQTDCYFLWGMESLNWLWPHTCTFQNDDAQMKWSLLYWYKWMRVFAEKLHSDCSHLGQPLECWLSAEL